MFKIRFHHGANLEAINNNQTVPNLDLEKNWKEH
jgi:hypothetical protein